MSKRDVGVDVAKALAMLMVVFVHVRRYAPGMGVGADALWADNFCSIASMSVFFMLSGCFSRSLFEKGDWKMLFARLVGCLWPVLTVFVVIGPLITMAVFGGFRFSPVSFLRGLSASGWFFFCLALGDVVIFAAYRIARERKAVLALILATCYLVFWLLPIGLFHACEMLPFIWFGVFVLPRVNALRWRTCLGLAAFGIYLAACIGCGDFESCGLIFHFSEMHLLQFTWGGFGRMLSRIGLGVAGAVGFVECVRLFVRLLPPLGRLATVGTATLGIFFVHTQLLALYFNCGRMGWYDEGLLARTGLSVAIFLASYVLVLAINSNRWIRAIVWNPFLLFKAPK